MLEDVIFLKFFTLKITFQKSLTKTENCTVHLYKLFCLTFQMTSLFFAPEVHLSTTVSFNFMKIKYEKNQFRLEDMTLLMLLHCHVLMVKVVENPQGGTCQNFDRDARPTFLGLKFGQILFF